MLAEMKIRNTQKFNKLDMSGNAGLYGTAAYEGRSQMDGLGP